MIERCEEVYETPDNGGVVLRCQYLVDHTTRHSWQTLKDSYEAMSDDTPQEIQVFLDAINEGRADAYLEAILAAGHARKRSLRGVRLPYGVPRG